MAEQEQFPEEAVTDVVNKVIENSSIDDDKVEDTTEAMIKVLNRQILSKSAATHYNVAQPVLDALVAAAKRRLNRELSTASTTAASVNGNTSNVANRGESQQRQKEAETTEETKKAGRKRKKADEDEEEGEEGRGQKAKKEPKKEQKEKEKFVSPADVIIKNKKMTSVSSSTPINKRASTVSAASPLLMGNGDKSAATNSGGGNRSTTTKRIGAVTKGAEAEAAKNTSSNRTDNKGSADTTSGSGRGHKRRSDIAQQQQKAEKAPPADTKDAKKRNSEPSKAEKQTEKRPRRSALEVLKREAANAFSMRARPTMTNNSELDSLSMALTLYEGGGELVPMPTAVVTSSACERPRRSQAHLNVANAVRAVKVKSMGWRDDPPPATPTPTRQQQARQTRNSTAGNGATTVDSTPPNAAEKNAPSLAVSSGKYIKPNPRWLLFPRVAEGVVDEVLTRMYARSAVALERRDKIRGAVLDLLRNGGTLKTVQAQHAVCDSTLRRYSRDAKVLFETHLGPEIVSDQFVQTLNADISLAELRTALKRHNNSSSAGVFNAPSTGVGNAQTPCSSAPTAAAAAARKASSRPRKSDNNVGHVLAGSSASAKVELSRVATASNRKETEATVPSAQPVTLEEEVENVDFSSPFNQKVPPSQSSNSMELVPHLLLPYQQQQSLLTRHQTEQIQFTGTKSEFRTLVIKKLKQYLTTDLNKLIQIADLITSLKHAQFVFQHQQNRHGIPNQFLRSVYLFLARFIQMDNLTFKDVLVEEEQEHEEEEGTSHQ